MKKIIILNLHSQTLQEILQDYLQVPQTIFLRILEFQLEVLGQGLLLGLEG